MYLFWRKNIYCQTSNVLITLESCIPEAIRKREYTALLFLDISKALYNTQKTKRMENRRQNATIYNQLHQIDTRRKMQ
jgi:hypothetical protein